MTRNTLIVPVENQVREFDAKLLLAGAAAERGFRVVLGSLSFVEFLVPFLPRGIYLAKSMTPLGRKMLALVRALGHTVAAWDEESLVRFDAPDYPAWRYSPESFGLLDHLFAWGEDDAQMFARYPGYRGAPIHRTGNPRVDLLRPELREYYRPEVDELREQHGDFVLINTNFAFVNHFTPSENLWQGEGAGEKGRGVARTGRGMSVAFARGQSEHVQRLFDAFRSLVPQICDWFPGLRVVLRPHPSENHDTWRALEAAHPNLHVIHQGSVVPWLMACKALLHNGCTTAVEAAVLGTPAVSYQPVQAERHDYHLPNALSHVVHTPEAVHARLHAIMAGQLGVIAAEQRRAIFARHLGSVEGDFAFDRVVDILARHAAQPRREPGRAWGAWTHANARTLLKLTTMLRPGHRNSLRYHRQRFPQVDAGQVQARLVRLGALLGRFDSVDVTRMAPYIFALQQAAGAGRAPTP